MVELSLDNSMPMSATANFSEASYYRARYYDQSAGRFISEAPLRFDAGINFYWYVKNNSTNLADPYGLKVSKCCRNTQVNAVVDFFSQLFGLKHCYIKTDTVTAGMGPANNGALPACPIFSKTAVTDHSAEAVSPGDCKDVPGVDGACVNKALHIGSPGGGDFTDKFTDERIIVNNKNPCRHVTVPPVNLDPA